MIQPTEGWSRLQDLFARASSLSPAERPGFLDQACGEDGDLRAKLISMLEAADDGSRLIDRTVGPTTLEAMRSDLEPTPSEPTWIGPYRIGEVIGEGGMGVVYRAEQTKPFRRRVALKVVRPGSDLDRVLARFESERQALAIMEHPSIAKVHEAGTTSDGRPYFAMEFVPGLPITTYCDRERLSTRERLELFAEVCDGVQHAHQKGVIHRDIKPSNVLVYADGKRHRPKIIDFGIAKATGFRLTEKTLFTHHGDMVGTPEYMSPEQADPTTLDIDTRTDVYSLGVLLYVLLVGEHPYAQHLSGRRDIFDVRRVILEEDAPRPSTRLDPQTETTADVVERRRTEAGTLRRELRGELDWIALRALEKDRNRRYGTAAELAAEVRRFLSDEPVAARPPSLSYVLRKTIWRRRHVLIPVFLVLAALFTAFGVTTYRYVYIRGIAELAGEIRVLEELDSRAASLWPEELELVPQLEEWLDQARRFAANLPELEKRREALRSRGEPEQVDRETGVENSLLRQRLDDLRRERTQLSMGVAASPTTRARHEELSREIVAIQGKIGIVTEWRFEGDQEQHYHDVLSELVGRLRSLQAELIPEIERRATVSRDLADRTVLSASARELWVAASSEIAADPRYRGLRLKPQLGLVPWRRHPETGLWEFWHYRTGEQPEVGSPAIGRESGLVFVLVPGETLNIGAERPRFDFVEDERPLRLAEPRDTWAWSTLAERMELRPGDRLLEIEGETVVSVEQANAWMDGWRSGDSVRLTIDREGETLTLEAKVPGNVDPHATAYEAPVHQVTVGPFFVSKYEMTQAQWLRFAGENPSNYAAGADRKGFGIALTHPVENVTWYEAQVMLSRMGLRLPSEAEWEYCARAGTDSVWWTGNDTRQIDGAANFRDIEADRLSNLEWPYVEWLDDGHCYHSPVGSFRANAFGLHDVIGNVWEWTATASNEYTKPLKPESYPYAIARGGGFTSPMVTMGRSSNRINVTKTDRNLDWGVRPARSIDSD